MLAGLASFPMAGWALARTAMDGWRWEYSIFVIVAPALALAHSRTRRLFWGLYPFALLALVYDAMRFVSKVGVSASRVHVCDLRALEARWFGWNGHTVHDWLQAHPSPILDVISAVPYGTFIEVAVLFAIYLFVKDDRAMRRFGWTFLLVNLCGFVTYRIYPAAPPWYFHAHGCVADLSTHASEGPNLARVDAWMGIAYFHGFYARSSSVFGAVPSLHVAYPLLVLLFGWRYFGGLGRTLAALFFATMLFAAVYLDHHWIIDVLMGVAYTLFVYRAVHVVLALRTKGVHAPRVRLPKPKSAKERIAFALATWFGCGYAPYAPGTAGTIGALPLYLVVRPLGATAVLAAAVAMTALGIWASSIVVAASHNKDPQIVVIDEVAGVLFALAAAPSTWAGALAAVIAFRLFDQVKPWPVHAAERLPRGWGVVLDDVVAGAWGAVTVTLLAGMGGL